MPLSSQLVHVPVADAADVADHMRGDLAVGVVAEQPRVDFHAGEAVFVDREARHFLVVEARADRQAGEIVAFLQQLLEALAVLGRDVDQRWPAR